MASSRSYVTNITVVPRIHRRDRMRLDRWIDAEEQLLDVTAAEFVASLARLSRYGATLRFDPDTVTELFVRFAHKSSSSSLKSVQREKCQLDISDFK